MRLASIRLPGALFAASLLLPLAAAAGPPAPRQVRVVVVANWENGADTGDAPGEYQDWVEREHLDEQVPVRGAPRCRPPQHGRPVRPGAPPWRHRSCRLHPRSALRPAENLLAVHRHLRRRSPRRLGRQRRVGPLGGGWRRTARNRRPRHSQGLALRPVGDRRRRPEPAPRQPQPFRLGHRCGRTHQGVSAQPAPRRLGVRDDPGHAATRFRHPAPPARRLDRLPTGPAPALRADGRNPWRPPLLARYSPHPLGRGLGEALDPRRRPVRHDQHGKPDLSGGDAGPGQPGLRRRQPHHGPAHRQQFLRAAAQYRDHRVDRRRRAGAGGGVRQQPARRRAGAARTAGALGPATRMRYRAARPFHSPPGLRRRRRARGRCRLRSRDGRSATVRRR